MLLPSGIQAVLAFVVVAAAITDLRSRCIPNWLVLCGFFAGLALNGMLGGWSGLGNALLGCGAALLVYLPLFAMRAMGGGDVKLMGAVGALAGPQNWFVIFILAAVTGGIIALVVLLGRGIFGRAVRNILLITGNLARLRAPWTGRSELDVSSSTAVTLPHGVSIAVGALLFLAVTGI